MQDWKESMIRIARSCGLAATASARRMGGGMLSRYGNYAWISATAAIKGKTALQKANFRIASTMGIRWGCSWAGPDMSKKKR